MNFHHIFKISFISLISLNLGFANEIKEVKQEVKQVDFTDVIKKIEEIYHSEKLRVLKEEQKIKKKTKQITEEKKRIISETELIKARINHQKFLKKLNSLSREMLDNSLENNQKEVDLRLKSKLLKLKKETNLLNNNLQKNKLDNEEKLIKMNRMKQEMRRAKKELEIKERQAIIKETQNKIKMKELKQKLLIKKQEMEIKKQEQQLKVEKEDLNRISLKNKNRQVELEINQQTLNYKLRMLLMAMNMENIKRAFFPIKFIMEKTHFDGALLLGGQKIYIISDTKLSDLLNKKLDIRKKELENAKAFLELKGSDENGGEVAPETKEEIKATNKELYIKTGFEFEDFIFTILENGKVEVEQKDYYIDIRNNILGEINIK